MRWRNQIIMNKVLVIIPGFRGSSDEVQFIAAEKKLLPFGVETVRMDWPYWNVDMNRYSMSETLEAAKRRIAELIKKGNEVVIMGESLGGVIATILASQFNLTGLILVVTPYGFMRNDNMEDRQAKWKAQGYVEFVSRSRGIVTRVPYSFAEDALKYNGLDYIDKVTAPVAFIVSPDDKSVPIASTRQLFDATKSLKEWVEFAGMEHTYRYQSEYLEKVVNQVVEFTKKYFRE